MNSFEKILSGGKSNSLGRTGEVIDKVLKNRNRLNELFDCLFSDNEWVRMRAGDGLEKVCRVRPGWLEPYVERLLGEVARIDQPSIQWHLAEILGEIELDPGQKERAFEWLRERLSEEKPDWIVARRSMETLVKYVHKGDISKETVRPFIEKQTGHHSKATARVAAKLLSELQ